MIIDSDSKFVFCVGLINLGLEEFQSNVSEKKLTGLGTMVCLYTGIIRIKVVNLQANARR